jgi:hypothetical protein
MKSGSSIQELAAELERQNAVKKDLVADSGSILMSTNSEMTRPAIRLLNSVYEDAPLEINSIAHRQIGLHTKIPAAYYDRMLTEDLALLSANVNRWLLNGPTSRHMLRTLDGTTRAFLSDRYRRIDNVEIAGALLPILGEMGLTTADVKSCELTDSRMYIKVVNPRIEAEVKKGDIVQAGVAISNSEVGLGSVQVSPLIFRLVCTNGMIAQDGAVRKYHTGRINDVDDNMEIYRDETIEADDRAFIMKLEDSVRAAVDQARFAQLVGKLREATEAMIEAPKVPQVVELASKQYGFTQGEGQGILGHLIAGGDLSLYGLANAVTRQAQDVPDYDRATQLEAAGYQLITMSPTLFRQLQASR